MSIQNTIRAFLFRLKQRLREGISGFVRIHRGYIMEKKRCNFSFGTKEYHVSEKFLLYHDTRWCKPEHRDQELYAMLVLEGMQAGVSWNLVLNKEDNFRKAFDGSDPQIVAAYDDEKLLKYGFALTENRFSKDFPIMSGQYSAKIVNRCRRQG